MNHEKLYADMITLFEDTLSHRIHKKTYSNEITKLKEEHQSLFREIKEAIEESEENFEAVAACLPEYAEAKLSEVKSKRKRDLVVIDYNMNMVSFFIPLIGEIPSLQAKSLADRIVSKWNEKMPDNKIGLSTVAGIDGGFKKGLCYITTAVCKSLDKPDDCYELTLLRDYRDQYLMAAEESSKIVKAYYDIAPTIVKKIDRRDDAAAVYHDIWNEYIRPCVRLIEEQKNEECKELYRNMVEQLESRYLYA